LRVAIGVQNLHPKVDEGHDRVEGGQTGLGRCGVYGKVGLKLIQSENGNWRPEAHEAIPRPVTKKKATRIKRERDVFTKLWIAQFTRQQA
jgi:hypothetical protein